ncbi:MAG: zinc-binding dehydrogenase [Alphaproteobacteria bacterium]|nr:zinc-binding dehydrogenase [Alphaproteobacteria bacterium]
MVTNSSVHTMRAVVVDEPGNIDHLHLKTVPVPEPQPGEIRIQVAYAGCNWSDIQKRQGVYPDPIVYPAILGLEVSGRVDAVGKGVRGFRIGDRVAAITGPSHLGGFADYCMVAARYAMRMPDSVSLELGAAFPMVAMTAYHLLFSAHRLRKGEVLLVHAIGGAVGLMLTQIAVREGAIVIGTVGTASKAQKALDYGAALVVDNTGEDFVAAAMTFTEGRGVDLVIDSLGGTILPRSFDALRTYGKIINIGEAAGYPDFDIRPKLYEKSTSLAGFELHHADPGSTRWRRGLRYVLEGLSAGWLRVPIEGIYDLEDYEAAQRRLENRGVSGKLLLSVDPSLN